MAKRLDLVGRRFGRLTVLSFYDVKNGKSRWLCKCDCGTEKIIIGTNLTRQVNPTRSCGCISTEIILKQCELNKKYNTYDLSGEYGIGWTSNTNEEFYFDLEDYDKIKDYCWRVSNDGYIVTTGQKSLHSLIMDTENNQPIDHKMHNKKDNRKSQLRICTTQKNNMNRSVSKNNTSGVTGVGWHKKNNKWEAKIKINKKLLYLGQFDKFEDAVKARKKAEEKYFGEYSYDNSMKVG